MDAAGGRQPDPGPSLRTDGVRAGVDGGVEAHPIPETAEDGHAVEAEADADADPGRPEPEPPTASLMPYGVPGLLILSALLAAAGTTMLRTEPPPTVGRGVAVLAPQRAPPPRIAPLPPRIEAAVIAPPAVAAIVPAPEVTSVAVGAPSVSLLVPAQEALPAPPPETVAAWQPSEVLAAIVTPPPAAKATTPPDPGTGARERRDPVPPVYPGPVAQPVPPRAPSTPNPGAVARVEEVEVPPKRRTPPPLPRKPERVRESGPVPSSGADPARSRPPHRDPSRDGPRDGPGLERPHPGGGPARGMAERGTSRRAPRPDRVPEARPHGRWARGEGGRFAEAEREGRRSVRREGRGFELPASLRPEEP